MNSYKVDDEDPPDPDVRRGGRGGGKTFVGYKAHLALDADSRILTREEATPANVFEGGKLPDVLEKNARRAAAESFVRTRCRRTARFFGGAFGAPCAGWPSVLVYVH